MSYFAKYPLRDSHSDCNNLLTIAMPKIPNGFYRLDDVLERIFTMNRYLRVPFVAKENLIEARKERSKNCTYCLSLCLISGVGRVCTGDFIIPDSGLIRMGNSYLFVDK